MKSFLSCILVFLALVVYAQDPVPVTVSADDYARWNTISQEIISNDGKFIAYELNPQHGDGNLVFKPIIASGADTIPRGIKASFGPENDFLVFHIQPPLHSLLSAKRKKVKKEDMPSDSLGIFLPAQKRIFKFPDIKSYSIPEENAKWIAFLTSGNQKKDTLPGKKQNGKDNLILFDKSTSDTVFFGCVTSFHYAKKGNSIIIVRELKDSLITESRVLIFDSKTGLSSEIFHSPGFVTKPVSDEAGMRYSFLFSPDTGKVKRYSLFYGTKGTSAPVKIIDSGTPGIPSGWIPSENGNIFFSQDARKLYLGTAPVPEPEPRDTLADEEKFNVDIWTWKDLNIQPQQKLEIDKEKKRSYLAVYYPENNVVVQLADPNIRDIELVNKGNGEYALGFDNTAYRRAESWEGNGLRDIYIVDLQTGIKRLIATGKNYSRLSPGGKYVVWYDPPDSSYHSVSTDVNNAVPIVLTKKIKVPFYNELYDSPSDAPPYGIAGWAPGDRFVYIYDRYDIWKIDPSDVRVPVSVTRNFGRKNMLQFRYVKLDKDEEYIPSEPNILVRAFSEKNLSSGFFGVNFSNIDEPSMLLMDTFSFSSPKKALKEGILLWKKENVSQFPDIWVSDMVFNHQRRISEANPQQKQYIWPVAELVEWTSFSGEQLRGLLYKPGNLDPLKKYPLLVYYYERVSDNLYHYTVPAPSRSTINSTFYTSNGYLVFMPDITYKTGYPGKSAYNAIISGVYHLLDKYPFVNKERMGLQGQSWGGYQTAWLITQTSMFAAAMAGAPVSNMTSAYGGIRWETGISRMFQYEHTQSRIGGTLWEKPLLYIENSPLFHAPEIKTPLLIMANDNDGAVPWYQGIELFMALRRLDKPVWLLNYNNEPHNLKAESWANRMDLDKRMFQFFNHYLKDLQAPEWMESGIPAISKGKKTGY